MVGVTDDEIRARVTHARGVDASGWEFLTSIDQVATLRQDIRALRACNLLATDVEVGGFIFDVHGGTLSAVYLDEQTDPVVT